MKTLKISLPVLFLSLFLIVSCKKKKNDEAPPATATSTSTSTVPAYYGVLYSYKYDIITSSTLTPMGGNSQANFATSPFVNYLNIYEGFTGNAPDAGIISINGTILKKTLSGSNYYYTDTTNTLFNSPHNWSVSGSSNVPSITFTNTSARPIYTGYSTLTDTIKLSQTNVINLTGISGADDININIYGSTLPVSKTVAGNATSITFTSAELTNLGATTGGSIILCIYKNDYQSFGGKNYKFKIGYWLYKNIVIQ